MIFSRSKAVLITTIIALFFQGTMAQINLLSDDINFRTMANSENVTYHYGDLSLRASDSYWGWLDCNRILNYGGTTTYGLTKCYGGLQTWGTKNFIQLHPSDTTKVIKYISAEAGEALTLARGTTKTINGEAVILLPEHYTLVTSNEKPVSAVLTPKNDPAILYVASENNQKIVVRVKKSDYIEFGDVEFNYYVTGVRDCFEDLEPIQGIDELDNEPISAKKPVSEKKKNYDAKVKRIIEKNMDKAKEKNN